MPTERPRIQVTLDSQTNGLLAMLAEKQDASVSATAATLIRDALELHEDMVFSEASNNRIADDNGKRISHDEAWR